MRRSFAASVLLPSAIIAVALLLLLWGFFPLTRLAKWGISLLILAISAAVIWSRWQQHNAVSENDGLLLCEVQDGPIVLVCGEKLDALFGDHAIRVTSQGNWYRTGNIDATRKRVEQIWRYSPRQAGRLAVMYCLLADALQDEGRLRAALKSLRQQLQRLTELTGLSLPLVLHCQFSGPTTPWIISRGSETCVTDENGNLIRFDRWQRQKNNITCVPVIQQAFAFIRHKLLDELQTPDRLSPPLFPVAIALRMGAPVEPLSLWAQWLQRRAAVQLPRSAHYLPLSAAFVDPLLPMLAPLAVSVQESGPARRVTLILLCCTLAALAFSVNNNRQLIAQTGVALQRWHAIPMDNYQPKAQALSMLTQQALLLERWQRQGEPLRYGLGLYPGQRLWLVLQQAIDSYIPPPTHASAKPAPQNVLLDSLALFGSGQYALKNDANRLLVNSLAGIKARPGWLIVVSGHTDNTGNPQFNQALSLKRAEAVRNWMRDIGDMPESCFAVQGYGESRPLAGNDTAEGRALNRRVEISLVAQADACRVPGVTSPSSQDDGGSEN